MFTRALQRSFKRQEGQALVLACLTVLVLSVAVITTVNLGHTVHEKIKLQNTADAAAYSTAAMEARAFNFYAFSNRTQASHYVNAMILHSVISFWYFMEAFFNDMFAVLKTLYPCASPDPPFWVIICPLLQAVPYVGVLFRILNKVMQTIRKVLAKMDKIVFQPAETWLDNFVGKRAIPSYKWLQVLMGTTSTAMMYATATHVLDSSQEVARQNDANINPGVLSQGAIGVLNECMFNRAHMKEANGNLVSQSAPQNPLQLSAIKDNDKIARAKKAMAQVANATRYGCKGRGACPELIVTSRTLSDTFQIPEWLKPVRFILDDFVVKKWGQTRLLGYKKADGKNTNWIHTNNVIPNQPTGPLADGDNMGADDIYTLAFPPFPGDDGLEEVDLFVAKADNPFNCKKNDDPMKCHGDPRYKNGPGNNKEFGRMFKPSVWAMNSQEGTHQNGGIHWRLVYDNRNVIKNCRSSSCGYVGAKDYSFFGMGMPYQDGRELGINKFKHTLVEVAFVIDVKIDLYVANVRGVEDGNHPWFGTMPFPHFEPGEYASACGGSLNGRADINREASRLRDFNQPSAFVMLNKSPQEMLNPKDDGTGATHNEPALNWGQGSVGFNFSGSGQTLDLADDRKKVGLGPFSLQGINAISRAQTYYHRPGNWAEQPNFFNPYWRPRLAAVWQGKNEIPLLDKLTQALPSQISSFPQKIITH